jgi:hypothetical protein
VRAGCRVRRRGLKHPLAARQRRPTGRGLKRPLAARQHRPTKSSMVLFEKCRKDVEEEQTGVIKSG